MRFTNISENEIEKFNLMFNTMNEISDKSRDQYIESKMQRYKFIAKIYNYSFETIRKIFQGTWTYRNINSNRGKYIFKIYYHDPTIYITRLNNRRKRQQKIKLEKNVRKHYQVGKLIRTIARATKNKVSAKTLSSIIFKQLNVYYSPKHLYWLIRNNYIHGVTLRIFPMLKYGKYHKRNLKETKRFIATPISKRDRQINERVRYGDVEIDTVEGAKQDNLYLSTMVDRKSRRLSITIYKTKSSSEFK